MVNNKIGKWVLSILLWVWTGTLYFFLEVIWKSLNGRPETISWTMLLLAIFLAIPLERFGAELPWDMSLFVQALICTGAITAAEFCAGCVLNLWLNLNIWDYSSMPGNLLGQICPQFIVLWFFLAVFIIVMLDWMRYSIEGGERPYYSIF